MHFQEPMSMRWMVELYSLEPLFHNRPGNRMSLITDFYTSEAGQNIADRPFLFISGNITPLKCSLVYA